MQKRISGNFLKAFQNAFVTIIVTATQQEETEEGIATNSITLRGYVIDADDLFIYLSEDIGGEVACAASINQAIAVIAGQEENPLEFGDLPDRLDMN